MPSSLNVIALWSLKPGPTIKKPCQEYIKLFQKLGPHRPLQHPSLEKNDPYSKAWKITSSSWYPGISPLTQWEGSWPELWSLYEGFPIWSSGPVEEDRSKSHLCMKFFSRAAAVLWMEWMFLLTLSSREEVDALSSFMWLQENRERKKRDELEKAASCLVPQVCFPPKGILGRKERGGNGLRRGKASS